MRRRRRGWLLGLGLLVAGCIETWQAPVGLSPAEQSRDWAECEDQAEQVAVGQAAQVDVARMQALTQCLEGRGWRQGPRTER